MKKIITLTLVFLVLLSLLLLPAHAAEEVVGEPEAGTFTQTLSAFFSENADTLLGVLTLIGSLLVAFFYKTGLLPLLRSGLSALGELLGKSRELTESFTKEASERLSRMEEMTAPVLASLKAGEASLSTLEQRLAGLEAELAKSEKERRATAEVLRTETELFYEMLASVNLPEAQKESMTESYYRLKKFLEAEG